MGGKSKKQKQKNGIRNIIFVILFLSATVPVAVFGTWLVYKNSERIEQAMHDDITMLSENQIQSIQSFLESRKENMDIIAQLDVVKEALWASLNSRHKDVRYLDNILQEQVTSKDYLMSLSIIDRNYVVVSSTEFKYRDRYVDAEESEDDFKGGDFFISDIKSQKTDDDEDEKYVEAVRGVFSNNKLIGYIVEKFAIEYLSRFRTQALMGEHGTIILLDGNDRIISAGKALSDVKDYEDAYDESVYDDTMKEMWHSEKSNNTGSGEFYYTKDGSERKVFYSDIKSTNWDILVVMDSGFYKNTTQDFKVLVGIIMFSVLLTMALVEFFLSKKIVKPINKIVDTLTRFQKNSDYSARVDFHSRNELGYVSEQIDAMLTIMERDHLSGEKIRKNLVELADSDALTGINNKRAFESLLDAALTEANENKTRIAVGFVDIDDFRDFNTRYGHRVGDQVIRFVALSLERVIEGEVGRIGGDEFGFFMTDDKAIDNIKNILDEYMENMHVGIGLRGMGTRAVVSCSIGVHITDGEETDRAGIIEKADHAMYIAKENGKDRYFLD